ncbi:MAG: hypothetical protein JW757_12810 [Anaerolineales bacterium]|nr:hypothetical protein [Anaerolineales bacterium]
MKKFISNFRAPLGMIFAISAGLIMLMTYVLPLDGLRAIILNIVMIGAAAALVIGVFNLLAVHVKRVEEDNKALGSLVLILALVITFVVTLLQEYTGFYPDWLPGSDWLLTYIQVPVESALMGVMAVTLVYAAARIVTQRPSIFSMIFVLTLLVTMIASTQFGMDSNLGQSVQTFISHGLASGGARGIIIGVALGTIATGLRILMGFDRPYGG